MQCARRSRRHLKAAPEAVALDARDHRYRKIADRITAAMQPRDEGCRLLGVFDGGHFVDVGADDERFWSGAGQHHRAQVLFGGELIHRRDEGIHQRTVHRVQTARIVDCQISDDAAFTMIAAQQYQCLSRAFRQRFLLDRLSPALLVHHGQHVFLFERVAARRRGTLDRHGIAMARCGAISWRREARPDRAPRSVARRADCRAHRRIRARRPRPPRRHARAGSSRAHARSRAGSAG